MAADASRRALREVIVWGGVVTWHVYRLTAADESVVLKAELSFVIAGKSRWLNPTYLTR